MQLDPNEHCPGVHAPEQTEVSARECLDYLVIFNERHLRRVFTSYLDYYHRRTHHSLDKDCPEQQPKQVPKVGEIIAIPQVGGMHHRYQRLAA